MFNLYFFQQYVLYARAYWFPFKFVYYFCFFRFQHFYNCMQNFVLTVYVHCCMCFIYCTFCFRYLLVFLLMVRININTIYISFSFIVFLTRMSLWWVTAMTQCISSRTFDRQRCTYGMIYITKLWSKYCACAVHAKKIESHSPHDDKKTPTNRTRQVIWAAAIQPLNSFNH